MKTGKDQAAPGKLETLRQFVNTGDLEKPERDALPAAAQAATWLQAHGLLEAHDRLDESDFEKVVRLREAIRLELLTHTGEGDPQESWDLLGGYADMAELGIRCADKPGSIELASEGQGAQYVAGRLFSIMYDAIRLNRWDRLKACRKESCLFAFYDHSKNSSGLWCDMAVCGNRLKAQRRRKRQTAG